MSRIFFDNLLDLKDLEKEIKQLVQTEEERHELWDIVDDTLNHKVLTFVLHNLPKEHHSEFLELFRVRPHDSELTRYLKEKIGENFEGLLKEEIGKVSYELLNTTRNKKQTPKLK